MIDLLNPVADHDLNRGLMAWWLPLENTYGGQTLFDLAGRNHGTLVNNPTWGPGPSPEFGALTFNGSTQRVSLPAASVPTTYPLTISVLARANNLTGYHPSFTIGTTGGSAEALARIGFRGDQIGDYIEAVSFTSGGAGAANTSVSYVAGQWHLITGVFTSLSSRTVYLDGGNGVTNTTTVTGMDTPTAWNLGADGGATAFLTGGIAAAWLWNRARTAEEERLLWDQCQREFPDLLRRESVVGGYSVTEATAYTLDASAASYVYTATSVGLYHIRSLAASAASYVYSASTASLLYGRNLVASAASYVYSATSAGLNTGVSLSASAASYVYTASDVSFSRTYVLTASSATYAYTASSATLARSRIFGVDAAAYTYTASSAGLYWGRAVVATAATYAYTASSASLLRGRVLSASAASYTVSGGEATLTDTGDPGGGFQQYVTKIPLRG